MLRSGCSHVLPSRMTKLIISYEELNEVMKIVKSLEEFGLLKKAVSKKKKKKLKQKNKEAHCLVCY